MPLLRSLIVGAALPVLTVSSCLAGTASGFFQVTITLNNPAASGAPSGGSSGGGGGSVPPGAGGSSGSAGSGTGGSGGTGGTGGNNDGTSTAGNSSGGTGGTSSPGAGGSTPLFPPPGNGGTSTAGGNGSTPTSPPVSSGTSPSQVATGSSGGICMSQSFSDQTKATVRVLCSTGQFVSIEPADGQPFVGTHGGAYRFTFGPGLPVSPALVGSGAALFAGTGTVTALRIINLGGSSTPLEMLVSF